MRNYQGSQSSNHSPGILNTSLDPVDSNLSTIIITTTLLSTFDPDRARLDLHTWVVSDRGKVTC